MTTKDDKTNILTNFLLAQLTETTKRPFFLGLSGPQGSGKSTLVAHLADALRSPPNSLKVAVLSIDDLYLTYSEQKALAESHPANKLVSHRGQPGTHDIALGAEVFGKFKSRVEVKIPSYDKSAFFGAGDRVPADQWEIAGKVDIVLFEGWCVGFRALVDEEAEKKWKSSERWLRTHSLDDVLFINGKLRDYDALTDQLDALVHIDAKDIEYVYDWRKQQEEHLKKLKGQGMTEQQVEKFVDGYMPGYELYLDALRKGAFKENGGHLRVVIGKRRETIKVEKL